MKSRPLTAAAIGIPLLLVALIALLVAQQQGADTLRKENADLQARISALEDENAFYKKAYELTLDDIKALSTSFGGQAHYERLAQDLREREIGTVLGNQTAEARYTVRNPWLWADYERRGIVNTSCLSAPTPIDTISDEVLLSFRIRAANATVSLYVDGNMLDQFPLDGTASHAFDIALPTGMHEIDFTGQGGSVAVERLSIDAASISPEKFVSDEGQAWTVFDCENASSGPALSARGALRVLVDKK